jgi:hypothetical protein
MDKDKAAEPGKKLADKIGKKGVAEAGKDVKDIWAADTQMLNILLNPDRKQLTDYTPEEISQLQKLAKILGRARKIIGGKFTGMSIGQVLDKLEDNSRLKQRDGGKMPDFTGRATTTADMGKQIALHTNGNFYTSQGKTWTSGRTGQRIRDANDYIKYNDKKSLDDAWAWVQSKGKKVNYRDNFNHLQFFGARYRSQNSEEYNGPVNEFFAYYETRGNYPNRQTLLPVVPVIFYIECNGHSIGVRHVDSFVFRNENTHVKIKYKKYQLNNENI